MTSANLPAEPVNPFPTAPIPPGAKLRLLNRVLTSARRNRASTGRPEPLGAGGDGRRKTAIVIPKPRLLGRREGRRTTCHVNGIRGGARGLGAGGGGGGVLASSIASRTALRDTGGGVREGGGGAGTAARGLPHDPAPTAPPIPRSITGGGQGRGGRGATQRKYQLSAAIT